MSKQQPEGLTKAQLSNLMFYLGVALILGGTIVLSMPEKIADMIGTDLETTNIIAFAMSFVGLTDIIVSKTIFKSDNRK